MKIKAFFATLLATVALSIANVGFIAAQNGMPATIDLGPQRLSCSAATMAASRMSPRTRTSSTRPQKTIPSGKDSVLEID